MKPKKSLGQNFLTSEAAVAKIIAAGEIKSDDTVLEIGPGKGVLTEKLLALAGKVIAIEKDDTLFELLQKKFAEEIGAGKLLLIHDDILEFDVSNYSLLTTNYKLVSNIPYNLTGAIIRKFLTAVQQPSLMVLLVQKEVAERIVARDPSHNSSRAGGKESLLSISVKVYGKPKYIDTVKAGSFYPAPNVDSAIIKVSDISHDFFTSMITNLEAELPSIKTATNNGFTEGSPLYVDKLGIEDKFFEFVSTGFAHKRKLLSGNLAKFFKTSDEWARACETAKINVKSRAENLNTNGWRSLFLASCSDIK